MAPSLNLPRLDRRLHRIYCLLESGSPLPDVSVEMDQFISDYENSGDEKPDVLFYKDCRKGWKPDGQFCWGMVDIASGRGIQRGDQWDRLTNVCEEMLRFLLDSHCPDDWSVHATQLSGALRRYLSLRGYDVTTPPAKPEQSEENGGKDSMPEQPAVESGADRAAILAAMQPADRKAYLAYQYAETMAGKRLQDREAYDWLKENGIDTDKGDVGELADYKLPVFATWDKQLRNARKPLGEQKYTRRGGRATGRSIVSGRDLCS